MKPLTAAGVLFWLVLLVCPPSGAQEEGLEDEFEFLAEEDLVYTAAKHQQDITESPSAITVITREQIENTCCTDVGCLLRGVPEVEVKNVKPAFSIVGARALTGELGSRTLVLVDGREITLEIFGIALWQTLPIHLEDIERIEIIRGPGSALYGANAHSMVVSILTRRSTESGAEVFLGGGEHDQNSIHLRLDQHLGGWRLHVSGGLETSGHWRTPGLRERLVERLNLYLERKTDSATSTIHLSLFSPQGVVSTALTPMEAKDTLIGTLLFMHQSEFFRAKLSWELTDSDWHVDLPLLWKGIRLGNAPEIVSLFTSNLDLDLQLTWSPFEGNLLIAGGNYRWINFKSDEMEPATTNQHRFGLFIHDEQRLFENVMLTAGLRFDYNNITPWALSPRLAGIWRLAGGHFLRLAVAQAFRKPCFWETSVHIVGVEGTEAFKELGDFFKRGIGNAGLDNEKITSLEVGYRMDLLEDHLNVETDIFYNQYRNTITFWLDVRKESGFPDLASSEMRFENTGREVDSAGGSVSITYRVRTLRVNANYTFRHSWYISTPQGGPPPGEGSQGDRVLWEPAHLANLTLLRAPVRGLRLGLALRGASSFYLALPRDANVFEEYIVIKRPPTFFLNCFLAWRFDLGPGWAEAGVRAFDLLNAGFRDSPAVSRFDGAELGGELLGRAIFFFLRGGI